MQAEIFAQQEGDAWFQRNRETMERPDTDWPLRLIETMGIRPQRVLEIGCSNGWRLNALRERYRSECVGIEPSAEAIAEGRRRFPGVEFRQGTIKTLDMLPSAYYDLLICYFVLHWCDRRGLLFDLASFDRLLCPDGYLLLGDFLVPEPTKRSYKHHGGIWTYKADYAAPFVALGLYTQLERVVFNHDTGERGFGIPSQQRAVMALLQKREDYRICE